MELLAKMRLETQFLALVLLGELRRRRKLLSFFPMRIALLFPIAERGHRVRAVPIG
jgi:hypothetical protein